MCPGRGSPRVVSMRCLKLPAYRLAAPAMRYRPRWPAARSLHQGAVLCLRLWADSLCVAQQAGVPPLTQCWPAGPTPGIPHNVVVGNLLWLVVSTEGCLPCRLPQQTYIIWTQGTEAVSLKDQSQRPTKIHQYNCQEVKLKWCHHTKFKILLYRRDGLIHIRMVVF